MTVCVFSFLPCFLFRYNSNILQVERRGRSSLPSKILSLRIGPQPPRHLIHRILPQLLDQRHTRRHALDQHLQGEIHHRIPPHDAEINSRLQVLEEGRHPHTILSGLEAVEGFRESEIADDVERCEVQPAHHVDFAVLRGVDLGVEPGD